MEIRQVEIKNFQCHKHVILDIHSGVNVFIGKSDNGKSAVLRAITWALTNKPGGDGYRSFFAGKEETSVSILFDTGDKLIRRKTKTDNVYIFNDKEYRAFGQNVPDAIVEALQIDKINIQGQIDPFFLLQDTPGEVASFLNKVAGLEQITGLQSKLKQEQMNTDATMRSYKQELQELEEGLEGYKNLEKVGKLIEEAEKLDSSIRTDTLKADELETVLDKIEFTKSMQNDKDYTKAVNNMNKVEQIYSELNEDFRKTKQLTYLVSALETDIHSCGVLGTYVQKQLLLGQVEDNIKDVSKSTLLLNTILSTIDVINEHAKHCDKVEEEITANINEYNTLLPKGTSCPLCGNIVKDSIA